MSSNDKLSFLDTKEDKLSFLDTQVDKLGFLDDKPTPPEKEPFWKKFGKSLSYQAQSIAPAGEDVPQLGAGFLEEISLGAIDVLPPKSDAGKVLRTTGKYGIAFPLEMQGLKLLLSPFKWLGRIIGTGVAGGAREAVKEYFKEGKLNPKEITKEALIWGTLEGAGELVISALQTKQAIDFISKASGKSKTEVAKFMADRFKTKWKEKFGSEPTESSIAEFVKEKPNEVAEIWEGAAKEAKEIIIPPEVKPVVPEVKEVIEGVKEVKEAVKPLEAKKEPTKKITVYHGGADLGEKPELKTGGKNGTDAGALFVTPSEKYAKQYVKTVEKPVKPLASKTTPQAKPSKAALKPVIGTKQAAKRSDIIKLFRKAFTDPIRLRKFRERASGIHKLWSKVTRLLEANDIETAAHEIGHNLHTTLYGGDAKTAPEQFKNVKKELKKFEKELFPMAYEGAKKGTENLEGFAEFTRMYVTNPEVANELAPKFYQKFEDTLEVQYPELKKALLEARDYYDRYLQGTPESRVEAQIAYPEKINLVNNAGEWAKNPHKFDRVKTLILDDLFPIKRVVAEAFGIKPVEVETLFAPENLYIAMRNLKSAVARTDIVVTHETFDYFTLEKTGEGYQPIIRELNTVKKYKEFNNFLVARKTIEKGGQGIQTGINKGDALITYGKYKDEWGSLAKRWDGFWKRLLRYDRDSGLISTEQMNKIEKNNLYYAPFQRDMGENDRMFIGGSGSQAKNPIKYMGGSTRDIIPPVEAGLKNIYSMMINAEKNRVGHILAKLATKQNVGKYIEAVPTPTKMTDKILKDDAIEQISKHIKKTMGIMGENVAADLTTEIMKEAISLVDILPDAFTRFGATHYPAGENIVTVFKDGKPKYYEVSPELYETWVRGTSPYVTNMITKFLRYPARMLRAGAILNPKFALNNVVRDTWERALFTKFGSITKDPVGAVIDTVYQPLSMLMQAIGKKELYIEWMKAGGGMSTMQGSSRDSIVKHLDEIIKGFPLHKPLRVLRELSAWGEEANRIAEYFAGKKVYPDTREGKEMAAFASRDVSIDFLKTGLLTKAINQVIPFFNVALQGTDKFLRMMIHPKTRSKALLRLISGVTIPSMILWWLNKDDEEIKELPDTTRDRNFVFRFQGNIYKIPVPFEAGIISHGLTQRMMDYMMLRDPEALKGFMGTVIDAASPNIIPTLGLPFMETIANKNFFTGKRIIPFNQEQLISRYQYKTNTSLLARETGRLLTYILGPDTKSKMASPAIIDHFINAWTGGLGRILTNITDMGLERAGLGDKIPKPEMPITQKLGLDAFVVRHPHSGAKSIEKFYDNYKDYISRKKSYEYAEKMEADTEEQIDKGYERIDKIYDGNTLKQAYNAMKMCQKEINGIFIEPEIDSKTKREMIDDLYTEMAAFAREANEDIRQYRLAVKGK